MKDMAWKTLASEYVIRREWLTVRCDVVELPNGHVLDEYYVLEYPTWVNVVAVTADGDLLLVRQYRHGLGRTCFELVAGVVEVDETPLAAAQRELCEETGYTGGEWRELMTLSANPTSMNNVTHCFLATGIKKSAVPHLDIGEDIEVHVRTKEEVQQMVRRGEFMQSLMVAPLLRYFSEQ
ncbi:MAG: NUDIX hydrolase [Treponema sp.]|nr:NUDIX hydrolase [Treponema sp.]